MGCQRWKAGIRSTSLLKIASPFVSALFVLIPFQFAGAATQSLDQDLENRKSDPVSAAVGYLYNLEYDTALQQLQTWLDHHPDDLQALNELATAPLHREMYHRQIASRLYGEAGEAHSRGNVPITPEFQRQFFGVLDKAEAIAEERMKSNPQDQDATYWAGAAHATRAVFHYSMAKCYLAALREMNQARRYAGQLLAMNPNYVDALLVVGTSDYVAGSLPWYVKMMASLTGFRGNRARGIAEVRRVAQEGHYAREHAKFVLTVLYRREKMYPETLNLLQTLAQSYPRNSLLQREIAQMQQGSFRRASYLNPAPVREEPFPNKAANSMR